MARNVRILGSSPGRRAEARAGYDRSASRKADRAFYDSAAWKRVRREVLLADPLCRRCKARGEVRLADQVHHVVERKDAPDLALEPANLEPLCRPCHNRARAGPGRR